MGFGQLTRRGQVAWYGVCKYDGNHISNRPCGYTCSPFEHSNTMDPLL